MDNDQEAERQRVARAELAQQLGKALQFALATGLNAEAAIIAKLIESTLMNRAFEDIYLKLR